MGMLVRFASIEHRVIRTKNLKDCSETIAGDSFVRGRKGKVE